MDLTQESNPDCLFWYDQFLNCTNSKNVSYKRFYNDLFIFCFSLEPTPLHLMRSDNTENLGLVSSGTLDLSLSFKTQPTENLIMLVHVFYDSVVKFNSTGELEPNE